MPRGHLPSIYAFREKREHKHSTMIFFSHYNLFIGKLKEKLSRKVCVNTERVYRIMLMSPGDILIKSNKFNMAVVPVKRSITACSTTSSTKWPLDYLLCPGSQGNLFFFPQNLKSRHPGFYIFRALGLPRASS